MFKLQPHSTIFSIYKEGSKKKVWMLDKEKRMHSLKIKSMSEPVSNTKFEPLARIYTRTEDTYNHIVLTDGPEITKGEFEQA